MNIEVVYCFPVLLNGQYRDYAERFVVSYLENPPAVDHQTTIVCNGAAPNSDTKGLFSILPNVKFLCHDNSGFDIGAYIAAARQSTADLMVCFGSSTYLRGPGWLLRMASAFKKHGMAQYGVMGNQGDAKVNCRPHIRTTAFWFPPVLLKKYPTPIISNDDRHRFEHGQGCFSDYVQSQGLKNWIVTWDGEYLWPNWDSIPDGFHRGTQAALLAGDRISEPPYYQFK